MFNKLPQVGFGTIAVLIGVNLFLGVSTVEAAFAREAPSDCQDPSDDCRCFGDICRDGDGIDDCLFGWHWYEPEEKYLLNPTLMGEEMDGKTCLAPR